MQSIQTATHVRVVLSTMQDWVGQTAERLILGETITSADLYQILKRSTNILMNEPSLIERSECRVVSKLGGSIDDLLTIFRRFGWPSNTTYIFLGNYLCLDEKGQLQIGVLLLLLLFKIVYPNNILLLRGLSDCEHCAADMGLIDVCFEKFCGTVYEDLVMLFKYLPLAALVGRVYFLSCGSLSLSRGHLIDFEAKDRPRTTCSKYQNQMAPLPQRMSCEAMERFRQWDRESPGKDYRNLKLFLKWNQLRAVVKSADVDACDEKRPTIEGPGNSMISFYSGSACEGRKVCGLIMIIHRTLCCTFHKVRPGEEALALRMLYPDRKLPVHDHILTESTDDPIDKCN